MPVKSQLRWPWSKEGPIHDIELLLKGPTDRRPPEYISTSDIAAITDDPGAPTNSLQSITKREARKYSSGWRLGVICSTILGVSVLVLNLGLLIWVLTGYEVVNEVATVYQGTCTKTKSSVLWLHLAINILSSLLLGSSNYCMQILSSPTRQEIDAAHRKRQWLSIGVPSLKNLFHVDGKKRALWILLGLSSIPLHLVWNSAVIDTLSTNEYVYNLVTEDFVQGGPWSAGTVLNSFPGEAKRLSEKAVGGQLVNMSVAECMNNYGIDHVSEYGNLVLVYDLEGWQNSLLFQDLNFGLEIGRTNWMCGNELDGIGCDLGGLVRENATQWNPFRDSKSPSYPWAFNSSHGSYESKYQFRIEGNVKYCLAEPTDHPCGLGISPPILITVVVCNAVKVICFMLTLWLCGSMQPLVTNGDAIESFLLRPDTSLKGRCLASKADVKKDMHSWSEPPLPLQWQGKRQRWAAGASLGRWLTAFIPAILLITAIVSICVVSGMWRGGFAERVSGGFAKANTNALLNELYFGLGQTPARAALVANAPQIVVSYIYLAYNGLFTCVLATAEWVNYSVRPRGLRVTWPRGQQRSRSYLQLPYTYGVPLLTASALLHWLISQSLFLMRVTVYKFDGTESRDDSVVATGFSPYAIVFALSLGGAMLLAVLLLGFLRRFPATMPLAACCSASTAASCQPQEDMAKDDLTLQKLQWGVVDQRLMTGGYDGALHATFSTQDVDPLTDGQKYA